MSQLFVIIPSWSVYLCLLGDVNVDMAVARTGNRTHKQPIEGDLVPLTDMKCGCGVVFAWEL